MRVLRPGIAYVQRVWIYMQAFRLREAIRLAAAEQSKDGRITAVLRNSNIPVTLRCGTCDFVVLRKVLIEGEYRIPFLTKPALVIDAGANIGISALYFALQYPEARVYAVEPDKENFELLQLNTRAVPNVVPVNAALWSRPARLALTNPEAEPWAFHFVEAEDGAYQTTTIPEIMAKAGVDAIDILKLDIEGGERELFRDPSAHDWLPAVRILIAELHDRFTPSCTESLVRLLAARSFQCHVKGESLYVHFEQEGQPTPWGNL